MKRILPLALVVLGFCLPGAMGAQMLYVATAADGPGELYTIDPGDASVTSMVDLTLDGGSIAVTGLAFRPGTGVLYGVTAHISDNAAESLVTINPANGNAALVGALGSLATDITFSADGNTLYAWLGTFGSATNRTGTIDLNTGVASALGAEAGSTKGGAIVLNPATGVGYVSHNGANGTIDSFAPNNGNLVTGATMSGAFFPGGGLSGMAIDNGGTIYAVNLSNGSGELMTLVAGSGVLTDVGSLPVGADAIAFSLAPIPEPVTWAALVGMAALAAALVRPRRFSGEIESNT